MENLTMKHCVPCEGGIDSMTKLDAESMRNFHVKNWEVLEKENEELYITKEFTFKDFNDALEFVNKVGDIAEAEGHHPDIELGWGRVKIILTTHAISGLSQNDFILAVKINNIQ